MARWRGLPRRRAGGPAQAGGRGRDHGTGLRFGAAFPTALLDASSSLPVGISGFPAPLGPRLGLEARRERRKPTARCSASPKPDLSAREPRRPRHSRQDGEEGCACSTLFGIRTYQ